ncbi:hypothetical protein JKP88DRAFT_274341 [Tribonema minus]|uniref:Uncharacterized protein n=1 Tax=Tribonema minus TaxID=303371 RepID=A0A835YL87_9STRA|nr:hypothetical protein JKP88DRAFT_274341 [Tribonema minus]
MSTSAPRSSSTRGGSRSGHIKAIESGSADVVSSSTSSASSSGSVGGSDADSVDSDSSSSARHELDNDVMLRRYRAGVAAVPGTMEPLRRFIESYAPGRYAQLLSGVKDGDHLAALRTAVFDQLGVSGLSDDAFKHAWDVATEMAHAAAKRELSTDAKSARPRCHALVECAVEVLFVHDPALSLAAFRAAASAEHSALVHLNTWLRVYHGRGAAAPAPAGAIVAAVGDAAFVGYVRPTRGYKLLHYKSGWYLPECAVPARLLSTGAEVAIPASRHAPHGGLVVQVPVGYVRWPGLGDWVLAVGPGVFGDKPVQSGVLVIDMQKGPTRVTIHLVKLSQ